MVGQRHLCRRTAPPTQIHTQSVLSYRSVVLLSLVAEDKEHRLPMSDQGLGQIFCGDFESFVSDTLMMVNPDGFLEDEDTQFSSPRSRRHDRSFNREESYEDNVPEGDEDDSDGEDDAMEIGPTLPDYDPFNISHSGPPRSGANLTGSGEAASRKRSSTPLRASSVESGSEPKRCKVV